MVLITRDKVGTSAWQSFVCPAETSTSLSFYIFVARFQATSLFTPNQAFDM